MSAFHRTEGAAFVKGIAKAPDTLGPVSPDTIPGSKQTRGGVGCERKGLCPQPKAS
jgi:hypothetical protein